MKKINYILLLLSVWFVGCTSVHWRDVSYTTPASEISLKQQSKIKIVSMQNNDIQNLIVDVLVDQFAKSGQFIMVDDSPDYWIVISANNSYRSDDSAAIEYNRFVYVEVSESESGGRDVLTRGTSLSSSAAKLVSISVYEVNNLTPITTFDFQLFDSDYRTEGVRTATDFHEKFAKETIIKLVDSFLEKAVPIATAFPTNADQDFVHAICNEDVDQIEVLKEKLIPQSFQEFVDDIHNGKYLELEKDKESKLSNYYVYNISQEVDNLSVKDLKELYDINLKILSLTEENGLREAVPNSLARLEKKLALIQGNVN